MTRTPSPPAPAAPSDASLAAARHDPDAFRELYERFAETVHQYFMRRTGSSATALDLTAETFAQAWFARGRFRDEANGSATPWVYGIARNVLLMSIRRGALERRATERLGLQERLDRPRGTEDPVPETGWADGADELFDSLPADQREAVRLRVLEEMEYPDIAHSQHNSRCRAGPCPPWLEGAQAPPPRFRREPLMNRPDMDPDLQRLGEALHASATIDLARERRATRPTRRTYPRSRVLASSTLALAAAGAAVLLALSGTAAVSPAYAITQKSDGAVFVKINFGGHSTLSAAEGKLIEQYHETS